MLKMCTNCNSEYGALTGRSRFCSKPCKDRHWFINNREHKQQYYLDNKEYIAARDLSYYINNKEECNQKSKDYYKVNAEKIKAKSKEYRDNNRPSINSYNREYYKDINNKLRKNLRGRLSCAIQRGFDGSRGGSFVRDLGCPIQEFKTFIENKFKPGMSWDNYGWGEDKWHLDHIAPLISFDLTDKKQFMVAAHYTNYQPLWQPDNFKKGAR